MAVYCIYQTILKDDLITPHEKTIYTFYGSSYNYLTMLPLKFNHVNKGRPRKTDMIQLLTR